jgi:hypothetical protein
MTKVEDLSTGIPEEPFLLTVVPRMNLGCNSEERQKNDSRPVASKRNRDEMIIVAS